MLYDIAEVMRHMVDLNRTDWDKGRTTKEDREKGIYYFNGPRVYIKQSDYENSSTRPGHILKFISLEDSFPYYRSKFGAEFVTTEDPYWPEPMVPDADGHYVIIDAVLIKIANMEDYLDHRYAERKKGNAGHEEEDASFNARANAEGVGLDTDRLKK